jgi:AraC family transcriptional regulator, regulatory protein of adaptative response / DNA-3-methyladenine glycosylase II
VARNRDLPYRKPYDWTSLLDFLRTRAIPHVESVDELSYRRTIQIAGTSGWIEVKAGKAPDVLQLTSHFPASGALDEIEERVTILFDLGADPLVISKALRSGGSLSPLLNKFPGLRVPGSWDPFELSVRAILGQQISVAGARTLASRIVERFGKPLTAKSNGLSRLFPEPKTLAEADFTAMGLTSKRAETIRTLSRQIAEGKLSLNRSASASEMRESLQKIPGIGPWTAEYIAMRGLKDTDAFPESDLVIRRELLKRKLKAAPEAWRPWRSYAALYLWKGSTS